MPWAGVGAGVGSIATTKLGVNVEKLGSGSELRGTLRGLLTSGQ